MSALDLFEELRPTLCGIAHRMRKIRAALRPLHGADEVARWLLGVLSSSPALASGMHEVLVNGRPGLLFTSGSRPDSVACPEIAQDGTVSALRLVRNPDKLAPVRVPGLPDRGTGPTPSGT